MPQALTEELSWPELHRVRRAIVVVDVVESVRHMQVDETGTIDRWRRFVHEVRTEILPKHGGRMVKSLGDGMLLEFEEAPSALRATLATMQAVAQPADAMNPVPRLELRAGLHVAGVVSDAFDVYGAGVNLAARLASIGEPGECICTADFRDECIDDLDARFEDLGEVFLKHVTGTVHAVRVRSGAGRPWRLSVPEPAAEPAIDGHPTVAVMPMCSASNRDTRAQALADLLAEGVIGQISTSHELRVISRLSSAAAHRRQLTAAELGTLLGCGYVLAGDFKNSCGRLLLNAELVECAHGSVLWAERFESSESELLQPNDPLTRELAMKLVHAVAEHELRRALNAPLPTLHAHSLLLAGLRCMHRSPKPEFDRAGAFFESLIDRHPRAAGPRAYMAQWHVLRVTRGMATDVHAEGRMALEQTRRAREADPGHALALAVEGFVHCHMSRDLDAAEERIDAAIELKPSESLAWLYKCVVQGFRGEGAAAWVSARNAITLSPLDPMRPYVDGLAASAALAAGLLEPAVELAERALRANRDHLATLRALAIARVERGELPLARSLVKRVLALEPDFTITRYLARAPRGSAGQTRERYAAALRSAGIPP